MSDRSSGTSVELKRMATLERNRGSEELRISVDEYQPDHGKPSKYISLRVWYRDADGEFRPTKRGVTVRRWEVAEVAKVFAVLARKVEQGESETRKPEPPPEPEPEISREEWEGLF